MKKRLSIELTENSIKFILGAQGKNGISIEDMHREAIPSGQEGDIDASVEKIKEIIESKGWTKHKKILLCSMDSMEHVMIELPNVPEEEMESILRRKLENQKLVEDTDKIAYGAIGDFSPKMLQGVYVQVLSQEFLEKISSLKLHGIDFEPFAADRSMRKYANKKENSFFIDIQETHTIAAIYFKDKLSLYRKINVGRRDFVKSISEILGIEDEKADKYLREYSYVSNIKATELMEKGVAIGPQLNMACESTLAKILRKAVQYIDYFQFKHSGEVLHTVYFSGGELKTEDIRAALERELYIGNIYDYNVKSGFLESDLTEELLSDNNWNLIAGTMQSEEGIYRLKSKFKLPFKKNKNPMYIFLAIVFVMFCSIKFGYYKMQELEQKKQLKVIAEKNREISGYTEEAAKLEKKIKNIKKERDYLSKRIGKNTIFNNFLYEISQIIPGEIYFEEIKYSGETVHLEGKAISDDDYAEFHINELLSNLEDITDSVRLIKTVKIQKNNRINDFSIEVKLSGGEKNEKK
ncbi:PilN domain-containing protein [uncultured Ilyobacter sp.]|uniref:PilN domain-containing protein n=1 Tax=uncultured Ilyobacter sp. TaxID=544433 RepID=UPI0029C012E4|nr:PilN domain-containing protein [uncultured Ilyobacter sp.]